MVAPLDLCGTSASYHQIDHKANATTEVTKTNAADSHVVSSNLNSAVSLSGPRSRNLTYCRPYGMQLKSDIAIAAGKFDPANNTKQANDLNTGLVARLDNGPKWWEVCIPFYVRFCDV